MIARITRYKMKADRLDAATKPVDELQPQIMAQAGMHSFVHAMATDGHGCIISMVESQAVSDDNAAAGAAIWGNFSDLMESPPKAETFDGQAHWAT